MIDLTLKEVCLLRVALTHLRFDSKDALLDDAFGVWNDLMVKLIRCKREYAKAGNEANELVLTKMLLKKGFAKKLSALLLEKTQELLDGLDNDITFEPTIGEEEHEELLDWADKFVDKIANHAVMVCLEDK